MSNDSTNNCPTCKEPMKLMKGISHKSRYDDGVSTQYHYCVHCSEEKWKNKESE